jgi:ketosteroid isomerase-like protein
VELDGVRIEPVDPEAFEVALRAFRGLQRGAATGDWSAFLAELSDDVRIMIPVPATIPNPPEGLLVGRQVAEMLWASHHTEEVSGARLEAKRVSANGPLVVVEARVEGTLNGELVANYFVFALEIAGSRVVGMYEYAMWTGRHETIRWGDVTFAREALPDTVIPWDSATV